MKADSNSFFKNNNKKKSLFIVFVIHCFSAMKCIIMRMDELKEKVKVHISNFSIVFV